MDATDGQRQLAKKQENGTRVFSKVLIRYYFQTCVSQFKEAEDCHAFFSLFLVITKKEKKKQRIKKSLIVWLRSVLPGTLNFSLFHLGDRLM